VGKHSIVWQEDHAPTCRSPSKPIGPDWDTTIEEHAGDMHAADDSSPDAAAHLAPADGSDFAEDSAQGSGNGAALDSDGAPHSGSGQPPTRLAGHSKDGGFVQVVLMPRGLFYWALSAEEELTGCMCTAHDIPGSVPERRVVGWLEQWHT
jgi:hypothetical protein